MSERDGLFLNSERLELEPLTRSHAEEMYAGLRDDGLYTFIPEDPPADADALRRRYERLEGRRSPDGAEAWLNWVVRSKLDRACLGYVQATVSLGAKRALFAYLLFRPFWGRGYAREASAAVLRWLFSEFGLEYVDALIDTRNERSIALVESLGFTRVELIPNADHFKGASSDEYRYRIFKSPP